jgi:hypothetical protein
MTQLSADNWAATKPPIYWLRVAGLKELAEIDWDLTTKWLDHNCKGWWYRSNETLCFERKQDLVVFKTFLLSNQFSNQSGEIS